MAEPVFHFEVEGRPLRAEHGELAVRGWCLLAGAAQPPAVRLVAGDQIITVTKRLSREDVCQSLQAPATARDCGFVLEASLAPGAYATRLEAEAGGSWHLLKRLSLVATPGRLVAIVEKPEADKAVQTSTRIMGWCAHPDYELTEVQLHYGNKQVPCEYGSARTDVPRLLPRSPNATRAGFITKKNIPVGHGPLRVRARAAGGKIFLARTKHRIDVQVDEDHASPLKLSDKAPTLGPARRKAPGAPPPPAGRPLRVLFALYGDFTSNSAIHVANLANQMAARGHHCTVAVPHHLETRDYFPHAAFSTALFSEVLADETAHYDVVHAWTTRENVREFAVACATRDGARLVVHLEDHEARILELTLQRKTADLLALPGSELARLVPPTLSHPRHSRQFLEQSHGVTVILDRLREHVPAGKPTHTVWPAANETAFFPRPRPLEFRRALGWADDHIVLFYHGNVHASNQAEVRELYAAVDGLNRQGRPCTLIRLGRDAVDFLGDLAKPVGPHVLHLGQVDHHEHIGPLMSLADYFVQPGEPDPFNDYRFPSKLPEFFSIGRPVILPRTNLGLVTRHGVDAYVLDRADAAGIAAAIAELHANPALRERLSEGALAFAAARFSWARTADELLGFYANLLVHR